jgi:predicted PurR-regulated permease PerM
VEYDARMRVDDQPSIEQRGVATRSRGKLLALAAATLLALYLSYLLVLPFIPPLVWATTAAVMTKRFHWWVRSHVHYRTLCAAICTLTVAVAVLLPMGFVGYIAFEQVGKAIQELESPETRLRIADWMKEHPRAERAWQTLSDNFNPAENANALIDRLQPSAVAAVSTPIYLLLAVALTLYILFFLYKDQHQALAAVRWLSPLTDEETERLLKRLDDAMHATIYGTLALATIQGLAGGLVLWLLGVPGAALWGMVLAVVAMIPMGTFAVWIPATAYLVLEGEWTQAILLVGWAGIAIGVVDNILYPTLVGQRLCQHTLVTFVAVIGGVSLFGVTGIVLGPAIIATTFFLLELWRRRTEHGASAERI